MTASRAQVAIVGGGPAGASTAFVLARAGIDVVVLDRARFPRDKACSEYMSPQASRILADMGVLAQVEEAGAAHLAGIFRRLRREVARQCLFPALELAVAERRCASDLIQRRDLRRVDLENGSPCIECRVVLLRLLRKPAEPGKRQHLRLGIMRGRHRLLQLVPRRTVLLRAVPDVPVGPRAKGGVALRELLRLLLRFRRTAADDARRHRVVLHEPHARIEQIGIEPDRFLQLRADVPAEIREADGVAALLRFERVAACEPVVVVRALRRELDRLLEQRRGLCSVTCFE